MTDNVNILMSVRNGERYLAQQIDSIQGQTVDGWHLSMRDNSSTDGTLRVMREYVTRDPMRFDLFQAKAAGDSAVESFASLLNSARGGYIMFADGDDLWMRDKIERSLKAMKAAEAELGTQVPILVHSDLVVVGDDLKTISESFRRYHHLDPVMGHRLNRILLQNVVVGCTAVLNPALAALARPIPEGILGQDWWAALIASAFGRIIYLEEPTVLYRRHSTTQTSVIDYKSGWRRPLMATIDDLLSGKRVRERLLTVIAQAARFLDRFEKSLSPEHEEMVRAFVGLSTQDMLARRRTVLRNGFFMHGFRRNLSLLAFM
jgi:glycosyltransferase involved in cell wall biosynthesis